MTTTNRKELRRKEKALVEAAALLVLKKSPTNLGGRGRRYNREQRRMIITLIGEAVVSGAHLFRACEKVGQSCHTVERWRTQGHDGDDHHHGPKRSPKNKLSKKEREKVLTIANAWEYRDLSL